MTEPTATGAADAESAPRGVPDLQVEHRLWQRHEVVVGIDEVGRGAIAGPVTVGACAVHRDAALRMPDGLKDSKLLSAKRRLALAPLVDAWGIVALGHASAREVDELGIIEALALAGRRALDELVVRGITPSTSALLLDGTHDWLARGGISGAIVRAKADRDCGSVAAASIAAKVARDALMTELDAQVPGYGWAGNKGYGSAAHFAAIAALGPTEWHRRTWLKSETTLSGV